MSKNYQLIAVGTVASVLALVYGVQRFTALPEDPVKQQELMIESATTSEITRENSDELLPTLASIKPAEKVVFPAPEYVPTLEPEPGPEPEPEPETQPEPEPIDPRTAARKYFATPGSTARLYQLMNLTREQNVDLAWSSPMRQLASEAYKELNAKAGGIGPDDIMLECGSTVCFFASKLDVTKIMSPLQSNVKKLAKESDEVSIGYTWGTRSEVFGWVIIFTSTDFIPPT